MLAQRPNYMTTQQRIMPYLPMWMKKSMSCRYNEEYSDYYSQLFKEGGKFKLAHEEIVGHTQQFCGLPFITPHFACLDTRSAYVLDAQGINVVVPTLI